MKLRERLVPSVGGYAGPPLPTPTPTQLQGVVRQTLPGRESLVDWDNLKVVVDE